MSMIDRANERMCKELGVMNVLDEMGFHQKAISKCLRILKEEKAKGAWILSDEELPCKGDLVIAADTRKEEIRYAVLQIIMNEDIGFGFFYSHWQLIEPPRGE